jgi:sulfate transport system permease protein
MKKISTKQKKHILPGFGLSMGYTVIYICLLVLIPLSTIFIKSAGLSFDEFWNIVTDRRVLDSYKLSFGASAIAAIIDTIFGFIAAWTLTRYDFPGRKFIDSIVDLPFALPTAIAGISLTTVFAPNGWAGSLLKQFDITVVYNQAGIIIALTFIGLPFVIRTLQPVLQDIDREYEEAAATLGAGRLKTFTRVLFPSLRPALITGATLAFARAVGEYGSVVFISGNLPSKTEITPVLIMAKLEQFNYTGAAAISIVMLLTSFIVLFTINILQWWSTRHNPA